MSSAFSFMTTTGSEKPWGKFSIVVSPRKKLPLSLVKNRWHFLSSQIVQKSSQDAKQ